MKQIAKKHIIVAIALVLLAQFLTTGIEPQSQVYAQVGGQCRFDQASCTWSPVAEATSYSITVTEVETNTIIRQESVAGGTTKFVFPITANQTYRCDVSAVNSCGTLGPAGSASALCAAEGIASTPAPTVAPVVTPPPKIAVGCGSSCVTQSDCQTGLTCVKIGADAYCARPEYQSACIQNPTIASCCQPPAPKPTPPPILPQSGLLDDTLTIIFIGLTLAILGFGGVVLTTRKNR